MGRDVYTSLWTKIIAIHIEYSVQDHPGGFTVYRVVQTSFPVNSPDLSTTLSCWKRWSQIKVQFLWWSKIKKFNISRWEKQKFFKIHVMTGHHQHFIFYFHCQINYWVIVRLFWLQPSLIDWLKCCGSGVFWTGSCLITIFFFFRFFLSNKKCRFLLIKELKDNTSSNCRCCTRLWRRFIEPCT